MSNTAFRAPTLLTNRHLQSILASSGVRKQLIKKRCQALQRQAKTETIITEHARLLVKINEQAQACANVILIHGWEGSCDSLYMQTCSQALFDAGFNVYRINLRDHGPSHHLNPELFNSVRLQEVLDACLQLSQRNSLQNCLAGFSLGGNFALRIATQAPAVGLKLNKVFAVCPLLNANRTMVTLETGTWLYRNYFVQKWQKSLKQKLRFYPELDYGKTLLKQKTLTAMNHFFIPGFTEFEDPYQYFAAYAITGDYLSNLTTPSELVFAADDPIIDAQDIHALADNPLLDVHLSQHGGHCGFIVNYRLQSWLDQRIVSSFKRSVAN